MGPFGVLPHFAFNSNCGQNQKDHILRWRETRSFRQWGLVQWFQDHIFELTRNMVIRCFTTFRVQFKLWSKSKRPYSALTRNTVFSSKVLVQWFQDHILSWREIWSFARWFTTFRTVVKVKNTIFYADAKHGLCIKGFPFQLIEPMKPVTYQAIPYYA